jgi:xanthine dehydrogenase small subunit
LPDMVRFFKVAKRSLDDISTVAMGIARRGDRTIAGLGGMAAVPLRIEGADPIGALKPISDHRGSAEYRLAVAQSLMRRFELECA